MQDTLHRLKIILRSWDIELGYESPNHIQLQELIQR